MRGKPFLSVPNLVRQLSLGELRRTAGTFEAVLLALLHARIAGQKACLLENRAQLLGVHLQQSAGQAVTDGAGLTSYTAAGYAAEDVYKRQCLIRVKQLGPYDENEKPFIAKREHF